MTAQIYTVLHIMVVSAKPNAVYEGRLADNRPVIACGAWPGRDLVGRLRLQWRIQEAGFSSD